MDNVYFIAAEWMGPGPARQPGFDPGRDLGRAHRDRDGHPRREHGPPPVDAWIDFLATFGAGLLTFLAGAEIDPDSLRRHARVSLSIGIVSFLIPFVAAFAFAYFVAGWDLQAAEIAGTSLSTTSVAVVYAVMIETGLAHRDLGKTILAACFVTDLGTVLALGVLFADFSPLLLLFIVVTAIALYFMPRWTRWFVVHVPDRVSEPEIKFLFLVLFVLGGLATQANSEAVLPAYLVGLVVAGVFVRDRVLVNRMRSIAFSLLTPFYFIKAGLYVALPAVVAGAGLIGAFLGIKIVAKAIGVWPTSRAFGMPVREANYTTLLMATGLTFGTIAALVRADQRIHRSGDVHDPGHHGHPLRGRPDPDRDEVLRATGRDRAGDRRDRGGRGDRFRAIPFAERAADRAGPTHRSPSG